MSVSHLVPPGTPFRDHLETKAAQWVKPYANQSQFDIGFVGVPLSKTSISHSGAFGLPMAIRQAFSAFSTYNIDMDIDLAQKLVAVDMGDVRMHPTDLSLCHVLIYEALQEAFCAARSDGSLFILGGDHSITTSSLQAFTEAVGRKVGVIHFDAHHDMRNTEDGGPTNGTPFRRLIDGSIIRGEQLVQIGLRNYVNAKPYTDYAKSHGVHLFTMNRVNEEGLTNILEKAIQLVGGGETPIYVSFDMDVLDPSFVPGVPAPAPGGMTVWQAFAAISYLFSQKNVRAMDIVCADPSQDFRNLTSRVAAQLALYAACGIASRK